MPCCCWLISRNSYALLRFCNFTPAQIFLILYFLLYTKHRIRFSCTHCSSSGGSNNAFHYICSIRRVGPYSSSVSVSIIIAQTVLLRSYYNNCLQGPWYIISVYSLEKCVFITAHCAHTLPSPLRDSHIFRAPEIRMHFSFFSSSAEKKRQREKKSHYYLEIDRRYDLTAICWLLPPPHPPPISSQQNFEIPY